MYRGNKPLCKTCNFLKHGQKSFTHKQKIYYLDNFNNCSIDYVVYCLICPCKLLYFGRTVRPPRQHFGKHHRFVEISCDKHSMPCHFLKHHSQSTTGLSVWVIKAIPRSLSKAERFSRLCKRETLWIYTLVPNGLNQVLEVNTII